MTNEELTEQLMFQIKRVEELLNKIGDLEEKIERLESQNDPQWDATDAAHPAWWRAHDYVSERFKEKMEKLDLYCRLLERSRHLYGRSRDESVELFERWRVDVEKALRPKWSADVDGALTAESSTPTKDQQS